METSVSRVNRSKESARQSYNRLSRWYDLIAGSTEKKYRDWGLEKLSAQPGEKILEIGFGTGHCLVALAKVVGPTGRVIGLDISDGMLAIAQGRLQQEGLKDRAELHLGDATNVGFIEANSLDGVFMSFTLELFDNPEIPRVLQECHRILKMGGRLAVVSMTKTNPRRFACIVVPRTRA
jgi:demethylmenaquinone methyltransferase/2-methoxy-6-polyprenyl-1,4-benzoquinol methylase